jgi:hydroxyquinol 1,2-dioxygenase
MAVGAPGIPLVLTGTVRSLDGEPIPNAIVDVWQPDGEGVYEAQKPGLEGAYLRGVYRTDKDGRYVVRTVAPIGYTIPLDGPVGDLVTCRPTDSRRSSRTSSAVATRTSTTTWCSL